MSPFTNASSFIQWVNMLLEVKILDTNLDLGLQYMEYILVTERALSKAFLGTTVVVKEMQLLIITLLQHHYPMTFFKNQCVTISLCTTINHIYLSNSVTP